MACTRHTVVTHRARTGAEWGPHDRLSVLAWAVRKMSRCLPREARLAMQAWRSAIAAAVGLDLQRGAVGQDLGHTAHDLGGVVAHANDRVGADLGRVCQQDLERLLPGVLA